MTSPEELYHFLPFEKALKVLETNRLTLEGPRAFRRPYTYSDQTPMGFDGDFFQKEVVKTLVRLIFAPDDPPADSTNAILKAIRRWRRDGRFTDPVEAEQPLQEMTKTLVDSHCERLNSYYQKWVQISSCQRIMRLFDSVESLHAWDDFADNHNGVALKIKVGEGRFFSSPKKIRYCSTPGYIVSLHEQIKILLGEASFPEADATTFEDRTLFDSKEYAYRKEWRSYYYTDEPANPILELALPINDISAVFLGIKLDKSQKETLEKSIKTSLPSAQIIECAEKKLEFGIAFNSN